MYRSDRTKAACATIMIALGTTGGVFAKEAGPGLSIETVSTRADLVTDGDARIVVRGDGRPLTDVKLLLNGRVLSSVLTPNGPDAEGLVTGLKPGANILQVKARGYRGASLPITNHSINGPVLAGPHSQPWICEAAGDPADGDTPEAFASDRWNDCAIEPNYKLYYRTTAADCTQSADGEKPCFLPFDPAVERPRDLARATTAAGKTVDYIVRVERGSVSRGIYDIAVLYDPADKATPLSAWNRNIVWNFGGATGNVRRQLDPRSSWANDEALSLGFLSGASSITDAALNSNRVLSAEALMLVREHVSDRYGRVGHVIGQGCSAGSMQQVIIGTMYPGLLDGAIVACAFPDSDTAALDSVDSQLLGRFFDSPEGARLSAGLSADAQERIRTAVSGHKNGGTVRHWQRYRMVRLPGLNEATPVSNGCGLPNSWIYDPKANPEGIRCAIADLSINILGTDANPPVGRSIYDNVGVQYGLGALLAGDISGEYFVTLNERIGGFDKDYNFSAGRSAGSPRGIEIAYETGLVSDGRQLALMPIIDLRDDDNDSVHTTRSSYSLRQRLLEANGSLDNYAMWRTPIRERGGPWTNPEWLASGLTRESLFIMDKWLSAAAQGDSGKDPTTRIRNARPAELSSFCVTGKDYSSRITDEGECDRDPQLKSYSSIRQVAGGPLSSSILKCALRSFDPADYKGRLDVDQIERLGKVFGEGVCDWSKAGVGQRPASPWRVFSQPGGVVLPPPPRSEEE